MNSKKQKRRRAALLRLQSNLLYYKQIIKNREGVSWTTKEKRLPELEREIKTLQDRLAGIKKSVPKSGAKTEVRDELRWFIDIYSVSYGYTKRSTRRQNKGKSRKKIKRAKTITFLKSVIFQPGMMDAYKEGRMGISPKQHVFKARKEEIQLN